MDELILRLMQDMTVLCGISCRRFEVARRNFSNGKSCFADCPHPCDYAKTHLYGCYEARRWDGKYIYYCPQGYIFATVALPGEYDVEYGIVAGPMLMGEREDFPDPPPLVLLGTDQVQSLTEIMHRIFVSTAITTQDNATGAFLNDVYRVLEEGGRPAEHYPIPLEKELQQAIIHGDETRSKELLNLLLGHIFFHSSADLGIIKSRVTELLVLLSRAAIEGGADIDQIFSLNSDYIQSLKGFESLEQLSRWLSGIINRYVSYVFDFGSIKHVNILYRTTAYVRENFMKKLTLEELAKNAYVSQPYLCKIFKAEMHTSITGYINQTRIARSKTLLADPKLSLAQVSNLVGFEDQSYFTKIFKKITGTVPGKYRKNLGLCKGENEHGNGNTAGNQHAAPARESTESEGTGSEGTGRGIGADCDSE